MTRRWVITGANGYLGAEICKGLARQGEDVYAVARSERQRNTLGGVQITYHAYHDLAAALLPSDVFVHCAGKTGDEGTWEEFKRINIDWTLQLFDQAAYKGVACFVYISSIAALGYRNRPNNLPLKENAEPQLVPGELYGRSKLFAEQALQKKARGKTIRLIILRPGLIYGHRWIGRKQTWLRRGVQVTACQRVPLVHFDNFLDALFLTVSKARTEGIFFVVDYEQPTLKELIRKKIELGLMQYEPWQITKIGFLILSVMRMIIQVFKGQPIALCKDYSIARFLFETRQLLYSTEKLSSCVEWKPRVGLKNGLAEYARSEKIPQNDSSMAQNA